MILVNEDEMLFDDTISTTSSVYVEQQQNQHPAVDQLHFVG